MSNPTEAKGVRASLRMILVKNKGREGLLVTTQLSSFSTQGDILLHFHHNVTILNQQISSQGLFQ